MACTNYQTALHLMRTGAAGVIIGYGAHLGSTTHSVLGIDVPMATAIIDAAAARRDYLDETGGRYVHLVAYGDMATGGDIAKALACGADAVMLGEALAPPPRRPAAAGTGTRPRRTRACRARQSSTSAAGDDERPTLEELLVGPTADPTGERNLFGAVRRAMGKCGYSSLKEFQKAELIVTAAASGGDEARLQGVQRAVRRRRSCCDYGVLAEECGFDSVFVCDHLQPWRHDGGHAPFAMTWLGALGARTERITIGTRVLTPTFRYHPAIVAQAFATLGCLYPGPGRARPGHRRVDERGAAGHRVAGRQGALRPVPRGGRS